VGTLVPVIIGFLLTTVLGGFLGSWLQQRAWDHQRSADLIDKELESADDVCRHLSKLLDKRLYRMLRLYYILRGASMPWVSKEAIQDRLQEYDALLFEWNDQVNLNLALVGAYFGQDARDWLQVEIYERCQTIGAALEAMYRSFIHETPLTIDITHIEDDFSVLNEQIYRLGMFMMTQLRGGHVGRTAPRPIGREASPRDVTGPPTTLPGIAPYDAGLSSGD
jgi:hypothetical protein